jgi:glycosyltransferase involved in cell wall biosynthesis
MEFMAKYAGNPKVVYICHEKNKNGAAARNTGIRAAKGEYIAFLDDDDLFLPKKLTKQAAYLDEHPEFDAVYCLARRQKYGCPADVLEGNGTRNILLLSSNYYTPTLMFRREALEAINGFDESFRRHQDYELLLRYFSHGYKIGCVPEVLVEIGLNQGENTPVGEKVEELKSYFFSKFDTFIKKEDEITPGFAKKVYATHYAGVFLSHLKTKNYKLAIRVIGRYFLKSPIPFTNVLFEHAKIHLKKR